MIWKKKTMRLCWRRDSLMSPFGYQATPSNGFSMTMERPFPITSAQVTCTTEDADRLKAGTSDGLRTRTPILHYRLDRGWSSQSRTINHTAILFA